MGAIREAPHLPSPLRGGAGGGGRKVEVPSRITALRLVYSALFFVGEPYADAPRPARPSAESALPSGGRVERAPC